MTRPDEGIQTGQGEARPPLNYAPPSRGFAALEMTLGAFVAAAVILSVGIVAAIALGTIGAILAPLFVATIAACVALLLRRSPRSRAWAAGIWVGIGLSILIDGICWMAIGGQRFAG